MKVAYLSVYRDGTGYSEAAINNVLALDSVGVDVVCRPIRLTNPKSKLCNSVIENLEKKDLQNVDIVIQHALPHMAEKKFAVKNIFTFDWETDSFNNSNWASCLNLMDEIWVPTKQNKEACIKSGVKVPIEVFNHPINVSKYKQQPEKLDLGKYNDKLKFYFIGEGIARKNISGLIRAYYSAFSSKDDVILIIKTNIPGQNSNQSSLHMKNLVEGIRENTHIYKENSFYPPIMVVTEYLEEELLNKLHATCDVFVTASHGEGGCLPALDAMGFGNPVIAPNWGVFPEICKDISCLVDGQLSLCFGQKEIKEIYTGSERWFDVSLPELAESMHYNYSLWQNNELQTRRMLSKENIKRFHYSVIGQQMKERLEKAW